MAYTRCTSTPSSPMTPDQGFMAASAPAERVAFSTKRKASPWPSGEKASAVEESGDVGELFGFPGGAGVEEDLVLFFVGGAVRGEGEGLGVGGPYGIDVRAVRRAGDGDDLFRGRVGGGVGQDAEGRTFLGVDGIGDGGAIRGDGDTSGIRDRVDFGTDLGEPRVGVGHGRPGRGDAGLGEGGGGGETEQGGGERTGGEVHIQKGTLWRDWRGELAFRRGMRTSGVRGHSPRLKTNRVKGVMDAIASSVRIQPPLVEGTRERVPLGWG